MSDDAPSTKAAPESPLRQSTEDQWTTPEGHIIEHVSSNLIRVTLGATP